MKSPCSPGSPPLRLDYLATKLCQWIRKNNNHPNVSSIWVTYIKLMKHYNFDDVMGVAIDDCWNWLIEHDNERGFVLLLPSFITELNKLGNKKKNESVLNYLLNWTIQHPHVHQVRAEVLKLVGGLWATEKDRELVFKKLSPQIKNIHHGITVCNIISLIRKTKLTKKTSKIIDDLYGWIQESSHHKEHAVRASFLKLVRQFGTDEHVELAESNTDEWLLANESEVVHAAYIALVEKRFSANKVKILIDTLHERFEKPTYINENTIRCRYLTLVTTCGGMKQVEACIDQTLKWWESNFDQTVITSFLTLLEKRNRQELSFVIGKSKKYLSKYPKKYQSLSEKICSLGGYQRAT